MKSYIMVALCFVVVSGPLMVEITMSAHEKILGSAYRDFKKLKSECEKSLPIDQECILIYEYTPVKRAEK